jgi:poly(A) polymerase/tRNA nucleotidyltransferase (CCA-adding enzyme)
VGALLTGDPLAFAMRLKLSIADRNRLLALRQAPTLSLDSDDAALRRALADHDKASVLDRTWLDGGSAPGWPELRARLEALPRPAFPLEGRDVVALGIPPGPRVGSLLRQVRAWWLSGGCVADATACRQELKRRLAS